MPKQLPSPADRLLPVPEGMIERRIYLICGQKVTLDSHLAELYHVPTKRLNEQIKRNRDRFPEHFMLQLTGEERDALNRPHAFTEYGVAMLSSVLRSPRAVQMNILCAFVRLRALLATHKALAEKIEKLERTRKHQGAILVALIQDIQKLKHPPVTCAIGFVHPKPSKKK